MQGKIPFEKWIYFDSTQCKSIDLNYSAPDPWVARVLSLSFTPTDATWDSSIAFLRIQTNAHTMYSFNSYSKSKPDGIILPVLCHEGLYKCKAYYRGYLQGSDTMNFSILDGNFQEVSLVRLNVTMLIAHESTAFLTK